MSSSFRNNAGLTLIEILISIVLIGAISATIYITTVRSYELRDKLGAAANFQSEIRLTMGILQRDIELMYTPLIMMPDTKDAPTPPAPGGDDRGGRPDAGNDEAFGRPTDFWSPPTSAVGVRPMRFVGTDVKVSFVSASNIRVYKESPECEFNKIIYELKDDPNAGEGDGKKILVKTSSPNAFEEDDSKDKFKRVYPLLHGVKSATFRYYRKEKDKWVTAWDSNSSDFKNIYPDIIEITIDVAGAMRQAYQGVYKFRPEIPLRGLDASF